MTTISDPFEKSPKLPDTCHGCYNLDTNVVPGSDNKILLSCLLERAYSELGGQEMAPTTEWVKVAMSSASEVPGHSPQAVFGRRAQEANDDCPITARVEEALSTGNPIARVDIQPPAPLLTYRALQKILGNN